MTWSGAILIFSGKTTYCLSLCLHEARLTVTGGGIMFSSFLSVRPYVH